MLGLPHQLYTPLFAIARIVGWSAHRMEELMNGNRIIRPAYKAVAPHREYTPIAVDKSTVEVDVCADSFVDLSLLTNDLFGKTFYRCIQLIFFFFSFFFRKLFYEA